MINDYKKYDLFGKTMLQRIVVKSPFRYEFPVNDQACFLYVREGDFQYRSEDVQIDIPTNYSLFLNCIHSGKEIEHSRAEGQCEVVIVTFHADILKKIYDKELPLLLQRSSKVSKQSSGRTNNDFLIQKYIEGLLFYFENPSLVNEDILVLKLKEIILLLSQTQDASTIQIILSQLFSPVTYTFRQVIEANLFTQASVEELAEQTNLSLSSFKREFKKLYNDSPHNYIKTKKLEKAAELLLVSNERITDIAFDCGFNDLANFTKSFSEKYHSTPTHFRLNQNTK
ncbi:AraC family transcriptional regulator [Marinilongibacter aquaticus]|uniref:helix-turn-helix domain-containing protein n=1 Tax=Marinilongibacter aquaticus TaxID=2975157 RepID=UPI0021BDDDBE|nr:AraC family transcriptional regulator [Marinilongibacter aquaticus]UBM59511.1 AraC family transcriptional regulator [Marinilongibacter aquaticus]